MGKVNISLKEVIGFAFHVIQKARQFGDNNGGLIGLPRNSLFKHAFGNHEEFSEILVKGVQKGEILDALPESRFGLSGCVEDIGGILAYIGDFVCALSHWGTRIGPFGGREFSRDVGGTGTHLLLSDFFILGGLVGKIRSEDVLPTVFACRESLGTWGFGLGS